MHRDLNSEQEASTSRLHSKIASSILIIIGLSFLSACSQNETRTGAIQPIPLTAKKPSYNAIEKLLEAEFILQRKGPEEAFDSFYELAQDSNEVTLTERLVYIAIATQNDSYVEKSTDLWLANVPTSEDAYSLKLQVLAKNKHTEDIVALFKQAIQNNVSLRFLPAYINENLRNNKLIESIADAILRLSIQDQNNQYIQLSRAHIALVSGDYQTATDLSKKLFSRSDTEKSETLYLLLAFSQKNQEDLKGAIHTLEKGSLIFPNSTRIITSLLDFLVEDQAASKAISFYSGIEVSSREKQQIGTSLMQVLLEYQHPQEALGISQKLMSKKLGSSDQIQYLTAIALAQLNRKVEAIETMKQVYDHLRNNATNKIAIWLYEKNRESDINNMVLERTLRENIVEQVGLISRLHEEKNNIRLSYDLLSRSSDMLPDSNYLRYKKALLAETLGNWEITEAELRTLLKKDPTNPQYLNALGYTLLTRTSRTNEAMGYIESAYEKAGDDPAIIDSLGWGHFIKGELEQSSYYLKKAWSLLPDAEIAAHYGESLWMQRHYDEAVNIWSTALETSPNTPILVDTIKRLSPFLLEATQQETSQ